MGLEINWQKSNLRLEYFERTLKTFSRAPRLGDKGERRSERREKAHIRFAQCRFNVYSCNLFLFLFRAFFKLLLCPPIRSPLFPFVFFGSSISNSCHGNRFASTTHPPHSSTHPFLQHYFFIYDPLKSTLLL